MLSKQDIDALVTLSYAELDDPFLDELIEGHFKKEVQHHSETIIPYDRVIMRLNYYRWFYHYIRKYQPQVCMELGVEFGLGSAHMVAAAQEYGGIVIGIDKNECDIAADVLQRMYPKNYFFINGDTLASVRTLLAVLHHARLKTPVTALVFQDSSHHFVSSLREWGLYARYLAPGSLWVCDDITSSFYEPGVDPLGMGMVQYFEGLPGEKHLFPDVLHKGNTIGMVIL